MGKVHFFAVVIANQSDGIFENRHHSQAKQIHFYDAEIGAIFFVPLHHHPARHGRWLERHDGIKLALADHHAAGVLSQMTRQILHRFTHSKNLRRRGCRRSNPASRK